MRRPALSPRLLLTLRALRAVGPCPNRELAAALGCDCDAAYSDVCRLRQLGLADRLGAERYDVTPEGRRYLLERLEDEPAADGFTQGLLF